MVLPAPTSPPDTTALGHRTRTGPDRPLPGRAVSQVVRRLQSGYQQDAPWAVGAVARLRREAGREAHVNPTAWGLDHLETLAELREQHKEAERQSHGGGTADSANLTSRDWMRREVRERREETAVHLAVTLWALHQQSLRDEAMHRSGWTLGRAVRRLAQGGTGTRDAPEPSEDAGPDGSGRREVGPVEEASEPIRRRFVRVGSASDTEVLATRLRELVLLLRSSRIPLDYARLADQMLRWQDENRRDGVRREWGRDFHRRYWTTDSEGVHESEDTPAEDPEAAAEVLLLEEQDAYA
ncbi:hypothetical protein GCM10018793_55200 [Streptomyces sulfonofaciens]|uniref:Type I-E CRISPR-associated protein Cse2/CasB n=1 Tax=Streptomyces sulfonofaciens TaxID=68272 RepID=A0A919L6J7_9ACTN|nr:type I-E CRISPR-associated protein Cse2/CasB [Streptomyces sulfonofaciens]GHH85812.1 hypothetical protein GCM10018793_55200 [Streptomyces sulfonofaciens]